MDDPKKAIERTRDGIGRFIPALPPLLREKKKIEVIKALLDGRAKFAMQVCEIVGVPYSNLFEWRQNDEAFGEAFNLAMQQVKERRLDFAEAMLDKKVAEGDNTAIIFYLKTQGKLRDYNEKVQIDHNIDVEIDIDEAARRIAFAMNSAVRNGEAIEGKFTEIIQVVDERKKAIKDARLAGLVGNTKAAKKLERKKARAKAKKL